ncbi:MAG: hypothetical protein AB9M53_09835 [Leptothrix sp. (in: b-proteobacteria)]
MKTPTPNPKDEAGAPGMGTAIVASGHSLPTKHATLTSEVLMRFLAGEKLTGLDAVHDAGTTRLAAVVHYLTTEYGWQVERTDKAAGCKDGRVAWVKEYFLAPETIAAAMTAGAARWCSDVRTARAALRTKAAAARVSAQRANEAARRTGQCQPGQRNLFEGEGVTS